MSILCRDVGCISFTRFIFCGWLLLSGYNPRLAAGQRTLITPEPRVRVQIMSDDRHDDHHQTAGANGGLRCGPVSLCRYEEDWFMASLPSLQYISRTKPWTFLSFCRHVSCPATGLVNGVVITQSLTHKQQAALTAHFVNFSNLSI